MDTDDLSLQTYNGIIAEAERFNQDLSLQFGILASDCEDDDDYLNQSEAMIKKWLATKNLHVVADDIFFSEAVDLGNFRKTLKKYYLILQTFVKLL